MAICRPPVRSVLAARRGAGPSRRSRRDRASPHPALAPVRGARRGSARALSAGRLLARATAAAGASLLERLWLLVPGGTDRDGRTAVLRSDRHRLRSGHAALRAQVPPARPPQSELCAPLPPPPLTPRRP